MKRIIRITFTFSSVIFGLMIITSGVYRHDTPIEKYLELANNEEFDCVGRIFQSNADEWRPTGIDRKESDLAWRPMGSCVLIDSLHILTAAHCVMGELKKDTTVIYNGYKVLTYVVTGKYVKQVDDFWFLVMNQYVKAKRITCYPDYQNSKDYSNDIAIIELEHPINKARSIFINVKPDEIGDTITGIGYGASGPGNSTSIVQGYNIKLAGQNIIDSTGGIKRNNLATKLFADFDCPDGYANINKMGSKNALPLEYGTQGGDSGGPIFRRKNNRLELIGVLTGNDGAIPKNLAQNGYYGQMDSWTRLSAYSDWINANK